MRWSMTWRGALPGRKPGTRICCPTDWYASLMYGASSSNGTSTDSRTLVGLRVSTVLFTGVLLDQVRLIAHCVIARAPGPGRARSPHQDTRRPPPLGPSLGRRGRRTPAGVADIAGELARGRRINYAERPCPAKRRPGTGVDADVI